jgi:type IV pilus assembly protein PilM
MGGTAAIDGIAEQIEQEIGVKTLTANPFQQMKVSSKVSGERLAADASSLVKACGLAMRPVGE